MPLLPFFSYTFLTQTYPDIHNSPKVILTLCDRLTYSPSEFPLHLTIVVFCKVQFLQLFSFFKLVGTNHGQGRPGFWAFGHQCAVHGNQKTALFQRIYKMYFSKLPNVFLQIARCICLNCQIYVRPLVTHVQWIAIRKLHSFRHCEKCICPNCQIYISIPENILFQLIFKNCKVKFVQIAKCSNYKKNWLQRKLQKN